VPDDHRHNYWHPNDYHWRALFVYLGLLPSNEVNRVHARMNLNDYLLRDCGLCKASDNF